MIAAVLNARLDVLDQLNVPKYFLGSAIELKNRLTRHEQTTG